MGLLLLPEERCARQEWSRCGESAMVRDSDSEEKGFDEMVAGANSLILCGCKGYSPLEVTRHLGIPTAGIGTAVVTYHPSVVLLVHRRLF